MSADFVPTLKEIEDALLVLDKAVCAAEDGNLHFGTTSDAARFATKVAGAYTELDSLAERMRKARR